MIHINFTYLKQFFSLFLFVFVSISIYGCGANHASIYRSYSVEGYNDKPTSVLIDAKQRAILSNNIPDEKNTNNTDQNERDRLVVCAEPSPDALSAIASTFSASGSILTKGNTQGQIALATALQENASQLGYRTSTIQLLRDGFYRQCEAYMNGVLDKESYERFSNKYINAMVTLLAIEQITQPYFKTTSNRIIAKDNAKVEADTVVNVNPPPAKDPDESGEDSGDNGGDGSTGSNGGDGNDSKKGDKKQAKGDETKKPEEPPANPTKNPNKPSGSGGAAQAQEDGGGDEPPPDGEKPNARATARAQQPGVSVNTGEGVRDLPPHIATATTSIVEQFYLKDTLDTWINFCHDYIEDYKADAQLPEELKANLYLDEADELNKLLATCRNIIFKKLE